MMRTGLRPAGPAWEGLEDLGTRTPGQRGGTGSRPEARRRQSARTPAPEGGTSEERSRPPWTGEGGRGDFGGRRQDRPRSKAVSKSGPRLGLGEAERHLCGLASVC